MQQSDMNHPPHAVQQRRVLRGPLTQFMGKEKQDTAS